MPPIFYLLRKLCLQRFHSGKQRSRTLPEHCCQPGVVQRPYLSPRAALLPCVLRRAYNVAPCARTRSLHILGNEAQTRASARQVYSLIRLGTDLSKHVQTVPGACVLGITFERSIRRVSMSSIKGLIAGASNSHALCPSRARICTIEVCIPQPRQLEQVRVHTIAAEVQSCSVVD